MGVYIDVNIEETQTETHSLFQINWEKSDHSEAFASELVENLEELFPRYILHGR